jgi:hypothetical protein
VLAILETEPVAGYSINSQTSAVDLGTIEPKKYSDA